MLLIGFHPDFSNGYDFAFQSRLEILAKSKGIDCFFPDGSWKWFCNDHWRGWRDKDSRKSRSIEVDRILQIAGNDRLILCGYSDGAGMANYFASYCSDRALAVVSYAGRLQRKSIETSHKFPVLDLWNSRDKRYESRQHLDMKFLYESNGHQVSTIRLTNARWHLGNWDPDANKLIESFLEPVLEAPCLK